MRNGGGQFVPITIPPVLALVPWNFNADLLFSFRFDGLSFGGKDVGMPYHFLAFYIL